MIRPRFADRMASRCQLDDLARRGVGAVPARGASAPRARASRMNRHTRLRRRPPAPRCESVPTAHSPLTGWSPLQINSRTPPCPERLPTAAAGSIASACFPDAYTTWFNHHNGGYEVFIRQRSDRSDDRLDERRRGKDCQETAQAQCRDGWRFPATPLVANVRRVKPGCTKRPRQGAWQVLGHIRPVPQTGPKGRGRLRTGTHSQRSCPTGPFCGRVRPEPWRRQLGDGALRRR
jgi:hypothetical protein